jgi:hypothetical protein
MSKQNSMNDLASAMSLNVHKEESSETDIRSENKFEIAQNEKRCSKNKKSRPRLGRNLSIWSYVSNNNKNPANKVHKTQEQLRMAKESKAAKKLSIVVGAFILSWLPFFIFYVVEALLPPNSVNPNLANSITWFGYVNSAVNPIIYSFLSNPFRKAFYRITIGRFKKKKEFVFTKNSPNPKQLLKTNL